METIMLINLRSLPDDHLIRLRDAANLLGVCGVTLKRWRDEGHGPEIVKHGKLLYCRAGAIKRTLASAKRNIPTPRPRKDAPFNNQLVSQGNCK
jgi:hypothetical protein